MHKRSFASAAQYRYAREIWHRVGYPSIGHLDNVNDEGSYVDEYYQFSGEKASTAKVDPAQPVFNMSDKVDHLLMIDTSILDSGHVFMLDYYFTISANSKIMDLVLGEDGWDKRWTVEIRTHQALVVLAKSLPVFSTWGRGVTATFYIHSVIEVLESYFPSNCITISVGVNLSSQAGYLTITGAWTQTVIGSTAAAKLALSEASSFEEV